MSSSQMRGVWNQHKKLEGDGVHCATGYPHFFNKEGWLDVIGN